MRWLSTVHLRRQPRPGPPSPPPPHGSTLCGGGGGGVRLSTGHFAHTSEGRLGPARKGAHAHIALCVRAHIACVPRGGAVVVRATRIEAIRRCRVRCGAVRARCVATRQQSVCRRNARRTAHACHNATTTTTTTTTIVITMMIAAHTRACGCVTPRARWRRRWRTRRHRRRLARARMIHPPMLLTRHTHTHIGFLCRVRVRRVYIVVVPTHTPVWIPG